MADAIRRPVTPNYVRNTKKPVIPNFVMDSFNSLIIKGFSLEKGGVYCEAHRCCRKS